MKEKLKKFISGRNGMDELSKTLFWTGATFMILAVLLYGRMNNIPSLVFEWLCFLLLILSLYRAFSRRRGQREAENRYLLEQRALRKRKWLAFKERRGQRREYKFFKCPGCGSFVRVPRGKGRIHINCKCGYTLYRKT